MQYLMGEPASAERRLNYTSFDLKHEDFDKAVEWRTILSEIEDNRLRPRHDSDVSDSRNHSHIHFYLSLLCFVLGPGELLADIL